jgi:hypothetical protein
MNSISINVLTGRMRTARALSDEAPERVRWRRLRERDLLTLDDVGDGMSFDPEGAMTGLSCT